MIIIGEKINATRKAVAAALENRDEKFIAATAQQQAAAGAHYLDVNGGDHRPGREVENMQWLVEIVQGCCGDVGLAIDSADPAAVAKGLSLAKRKAILNSISLEATRLEPLLDIVRGHDCMVVALLMSDAGPPTGVDDRLATAEALIGHLTAAGRSLDDIIIDPCFFPISSDSSGGPAVMEAIRQIRARWAGVHIGGGVSNISYGLPKRRHVNLAALAAAIVYGMDVAIVDPTTPGLVPLMLAAEAVSGRDEFCMGYVTAEREGKLE